MTCNCNDNYGCGGACDPCSSNTAIKQAVNDALAAEKVTLEGYVTEAALSATEAESSAADAASSASAAAQSQANAETAANTATQAAISVTNTAIVLEETAERIEHAQDLLEEQISALQTKPIYFEVSTPTSSLVLPETETVFNVRSIYVASARQAVGYGFTFDKETRTVTLAEKITAEQIAETEEGYILVEVICDVYSSDDPTSFPLLLASPAGTGLVTHSDGNTVRTHLDRFYQAFSGVILSPTWSTVQDTNSLKFSGGLFSFAGQPLVGQEKTVEITDSTVCIVITSSGEYEARTRIPFDGSIVVGHVRAGSLVEVIGDMNRSAFGFAGTPTSIPWLPVELRKIEEQIPINITINSDGSLSYSTDYDVSIKKAGGTTYYVDCTNGSDTTGDGTISKPFQRIKYALEKTPLARTIMVKGGMTYTRDFTWNLSIVDRDLDVIGYDGTPILTTIEPNAVWTAQGSAGVYQYTGNLVLNVVDYSNLDSYGHPQVLKSVTTLEQCIATAGTSYLSGSTLYIHLFDSRVPDANSKLVMQITNGRIQDNCKVYLENLDFGASFRGFQAEVRDANKQGYLYAKNCNFGLTVTANSFNSLGVHTILQDCTGSFGMQDIANYHSDTLGLGKKPWFIEINCKFGNGGFDGLPNNNASTAHDGAVGIRIGGEYFATYGRVVHDVHDGTVTANFNCYSHDSSRSDYLGGACFTAGQGSDPTGKAKVYLYGCTHGGSNAAIIKDGQSEIWLFDTPIGPNSQYNATSPYKFVQ